MGDELGQDVPANVYSVFTGCSVFARARFRPQVVHPGSHFNKDAIGRPKVGSPLATPIQNQDLMSHQDGLGDNGPEGHRVEQAG